jgi:hypothetical protein
LKLFELHYCCRCLSCNCMLLLLPASLQLVHSIAAWVAKYGPLLSSFEWQERYDRPYRLCLKPTERAPAYAAIAAALQQAVASARGLCLRSCKLADVSWDCHTILQQLASVNSLTSLYLSLNFDDGHDIGQCIERLAGVVAVLPQLQQLRKLVLTIDDSSYGQLEQVDPLLEPLAQLTNLTSLELGELWSMG